MGYFIGYYTAIPLKMYEKLANQNSQMLQAQKMANGQLLFLAWHIITLLTLC